MNKIKLKKVYHPYNLWEEIKHNMWGEVTNKDQYLSDSISFTSNHELYGFYMNRVVNEWPISCENALTDNLLNKKAWIGHAACALAIGCPEYITRKAWGYLTDEQRFLANKEAAKAIQRWEINYIKDKEIYKNMGGQMLFGWDS